MQFLTPIFGALMFAAAPAASTSVLEMPDCLVTLIEEAQVPAQEAGVLVQATDGEATTVKLPVPAGTVVKTGSLLAQIDDAKTRMEVRVADAKLAVAREKATDKINIRYAKAASKVAEATYLVSAEANRDVKGSVPQTVLNELILKHHETLLSIEKADLENRVATQEMRVAEVEKDAAQENLRRRKVLSPLDGIVVHLHRHAGEWVQPGDAVVHVIRMDRLWVEGYADASQVNPAQVQNRSAAVIVTRAAKEKIPLVGRIVFANPNIQAGGKFLVRAEVQNRLDGNDAWLISPGQGASMTIGLK